ncbi:MAG: hypothetical protein KatS3mg033_1992 [Thermonema sp.]|jgi:hypothetical protein|nr:MAG: hypothetical protein KatS3mg033_1992 [Thermonema sp.]
MERNKPRLIPFCVHILFGIGEVRQELFEKM